MTEEAAFVWDGATLSTIGELLNAVVAVAREGDEVRVGRFKATYAKYLIAYDGKLPLREAAQMVNQNVGYLAGYCDPGTARMVLAVFGAQHPFIASPPAAEVDGGGQS